MSSTIITLALGLAFIMALVLFLFVVFMFLYTDPGPKRDDNEDPMSIELFAHMVTSWQQTDKAIK